MALPKHSQPRKAWKTLLIAFLLGLAGLVVATIWLGEPGDLRLLLRLSGSTLAGAGVLLVASFIGGGARLKVLLRMAGSNINIWRATRAHVLGLFAAAITPSGGGNGVAIGFALLRDGVKANVAWSAAVYGSVLDLFFYAWALPVAGFVLRGSDLISARLFWLVLATSALAFLLWYGLAFHLGRVRHLVRPLLSWRALKRWRRPTLRFLDDIGSATATMSRGGLLQHVGLSGLTMLVHVGFYAIFHLFAAALGSAFPIVVTFSLMLVISAVSQAVPTPGGSGYFEVALSYAFSQSGAQAQVTAAVVAYRALTYYAPIVLGALLGGGVLIAELNRANADRNAAGPATEPAVETSSGPERGASPSSALENSERSADDHPHNA